MEYSPSRHTYSNPHPQQSSVSQPKMSIIAMATPSPHPMFRSDNPWDSTRPFSDHSSRPHTETQPIALPSIRQTFPDLYPDGLWSDGPASRPLAHRSLSVAAPGPLASPEYIHSPTSSKRRRISVEDEQSPLRAKQIPRVYRSPERSPLRQLSSPHREHGSSETWASSTRTSSFASNGGIPTIEMNRRVEPRPTLLSLPPTMELDRDLAPLHHAHEAVSGNTGAPLLDGVPTYHGREYNCSSYHHPTRFQSLSTSSTRPYDRVPYSAGGAYSAHYHETGRYGDLGGIGIGGDAKQRKRRGNLPKETTDKLRAWFVAHLQHPYPTEDEKQELMRQTGLQMNQISNWFINARRRQLPAMINSARAESEVIIGRAGGSAGREGKILASTERTADYGKREEALPLSDGEGGVYDDDMGNLRKRRAGDLNRESV